ncbi:OprD family porin [Phytopseudomonas punonensis]|uniref:Outer membrane porin, OprD family n=1 Tax=Phytopseudomonas punonensis TaxID=1220495 RepID=A0A1M7K141_9GAMM|nr:OprD family porin [Pseudomonas punonensis]SHM59009.1 outer membrane porin, OprD family [Pseudomonas punonensis]
MTARKIISLGLIGAGTMALAMPFAAHAEGFVEDAKVNLNLRNYYFNRNFLNHTGPQVQGDDQGQRAEWAQSFILDARSGYTAGTVGFGLDVLGMYAVKLDGGKGTINSELFPTHGTGNDAHSAGDFGRTAVAAKAKISKTELKVGEWFAVLPILRADDGRSLPQTFKGGQLTVNEIEGLSLYGGRFNGNSARNDASLERMSYSGFKTNAFDFAGGEFKFNEKRTMIGLWRAELNDIYQQNYLQLTHSQPVGDWVLGANLGYVDSKDEGSSKAGKLDNKVYQGSFSAKTGMNTFTVNYQKLSGDSRFIKVDGTSGGLLVNDGFTSAFDGVDERSWAIRHDYSFAALGVPGLSLMNRYTKGDNIRASATRDDAEEWSRETELAYTLQDGVLKNLNIRVRNSSLRRDVGQDMSENRLIINYPLSIL